VLGPPAGQGRVVVSGRPADGLHPQSGRVLHPFPTSGTPSSTNNNLFGRKAGPEPHGFPRKKKFQAPRTAPQRGSTRATRSRGAQSRRPPAVPVYWAREVDSARGLAEYGQGGLGRVHTPCVTARSRFAEFCRGLAELSGPRLGTPAGRDRAGCVLGGSPCKRLRPGPRLAPAWRCARRLGEGRRAAWVATV